MLLRKLPRPDSGGLVDPGDDVVLASFKLKLEAEGDLGLKAEGTGELPGPEYTGTGKGKAPKEMLSTIIEVINTRFGTAFDARDLVDGVTAQLVADDRLQQAAKVNDIGNFAVPSQDAMDDALVSRHEKHEDFINKVFREQAVGDFFRALMLNQVSGRLRSPTVKSISHVDVTITDRGT
jgi:type I restriction enzyme, R subunit